MSREQLAAKRASLGAFILTLLMLGTCSATGLSTARGNGAELVLRAPASFLFTIVILCGPLLLAQAVVIGLASSRPTRRRAGFLVGAIAVAAAGSLLTAYGAFVASLARLCVGGVPTAAQDAACAAGTGGLAAVFGISVLVALPFAIALRRDLLAPPSSG